MPRAFFHDYRQTCVYHITMNKAHGVPVFGHLDGCLPDVSIKKTLLGEIIGAYIRGLSSLNPKLRVLQYVVMPDHIHILLQVTEPLERSLGSYMGMLKVKIGQDYRERTGMQFTVFQPDYYDCILFRARPLDVVYRYIRENPYRLAVRRERPDYFRRINNLTIGSYQVQAYGNLQLLDNPFKEQVVVHRTDTPERRELNRQLWLYNAGNGGVLVSPFISQAEKAIREEAEALNAKIILVTNEQFGERFKPSAHNFELCDTGRLLIVSLALPGAPGRDGISRSECMALNELAAAIARA